MNKRIEYFDTTKGLLMFFLVWGHMIIFAKKLDIVNDFTQTIQYTVPFYRVFFMQTFFFITGFCTSWHTPFRNFLAKNFKTIVLPAYIFIPFAYLTNLIIGENGDIRAFVGFYLKYLTIGIPWFLSALFISKITYWIIHNKIQNRILEWALVAFIFCVGLVIKEATTLLNYWYYQHAMLMLPFLALGSLAKTINTNDLKIFNLAGGGKIAKSSLLVFFSLPYFGLILLWQLMGLGVGFPAIDSYLDVHYITAPFHLAFAASGTALVLLLARSLQKLEFIKVIGRQSLFIYLFHSFVVFGLMRVCIILDVSTKSYTDGAIFYIGVYILSFLILYWGCRMMENRHFCWMVGKF